MKKTANVIVFLLLLMGLLFCFSSDTIAKTIIKSADKKPFLEFKTDKLKNGTVGYDYVDFVEIKSDQKYSIFVDEIPSGFFFHETTGGVYAKNPKKGKHELKIRVETNNGLAKIEKTFPILIQAKKAVKKAKDFLIEINGQKYTAKEIHKLEKKSGKALYTIKKALPDFQPRLVSVPGSKNNPKQMETDQMKQYVKNMLNLVQITDEYKSSKMDASAKKLLKTKLLSHQKNSNKLHLEFQKSELEQKIKLKFQRIDLI